MYGSYQRHLRNAANAEVSALQAEARKAAAYIKEHGPVEDAALRSLFSTRALNFAVELRSCYREIRGASAYYVSNL